MVQMTMQVPENLAPKLRRMDKWLPTVLELSLAGFKTPVTQTVAELIEFLSKGPTPKQVSGYKVSERAQKRIQRLLPSTNPAGSPKMNKLNSMKAKHSTTWLRCLRLKRMDKSLTKANERRSFKLPAKISC